MKASLALLVILIVSGHSFTAQKLKLSTFSDSCLYYCYTGSKFVMDDGDYTTTEKAYRTQMDNAALPHKKLLQSIELIGSRVEPLVNNLTHLNNF
ncbi:MAG: hypothetical protein AABY93_04935 [Bacteroidota bacterium]